MAVYSECVFVWWRLIHMNCCVKKKKKKKKFNQMFLIDIICVYVIWKLLKVLINSKGFFFRLVWYKAFILLALQSPHSQGPWKPNCIVFTPDTLHSQMTFEMFTSLLSWASQLFSGVTAFTALLIKSAGSQCRSTFSPQRSLRFIRSRGHL